MPYGASGRERAPNNYVPYGAMVDKGLISKDNRLILHTHMYHDKYTTVY